MGRTEIEVGGDRGADGEPPDGLRRRPGTSLYAEAAQIASEMKGYLKSKPSAARALSCFAFDRRQRS